MTFVWWLAAPMMLAFGIAHGLAARASLRDGEHLSLLGHLFMAVAAGLVLASWVIGQFWSHLSLTFMHMVSMTMSIGAAGLAAAVLSCILSLAAAMKKHFDRAAQPSLKEDLAFAEGDWPPPPNVGGIRSSAE